jgi:KUP system potassium uptake protein
MLREPQAVENPFFLSFPEPLLIPAVLLATLATVIASQATISGAFSATQQAIQLGFLPRMRTIHTSSKEAGQIYIPFINGLLLVSVLLVTISFGSSSALAHAYGVSVTTTMLCSTVLTFFVVWKNWKYPLSLAIVSTSFFLILDSVLLAGCLSKIFHGGWFPLLLGLCVLLLMTTWRKGRSLLMQAIHEDDPELTSFINQISGAGLPVVERTAVYLVSDPRTAPQALMHNLKHNMVLHKTNLIVTVAFENRPWVPFHERIVIDDLGNHFKRVTIRYGFKDVPDIPSALTYAREWHALDIDLFASSYFLSRETVVPKTKGKMPKWREEIFASMSRNAGSIVSYFRIPTNQVIELGTRVSF